VYFISNLSAFTSNSATTKRSPLLKYPIQWVPPLGTPAMNEVYLFFFDQMPARLSRHFG
jgi:hypothetical protein